MERINKYIASCGVCSRRKAEELILSGRVKINGEVVSSLSTIIDTKKDIVNVDGKDVQKQEKMVYIMLNKPKGYVTTSSEQFGRNCVVQLIDEDVRVYPVGRLDMYTEGLLLLTNDGEFANMLMHPKNKINKKYIVETKKDVIVTDNMIKTLENGVDIGGYVTKEAKVLKIGNNKLEINIKEGKNRQVRKMCEAVGIPVKNLKRVQIANLRLGNLPVGKYRYLTNEEVKFFSLFK